ncbi:MAG: hypothetical protein WEE69_01890 [Acidimicrobiia bacterium]
MTAVAEREATADVPPPPPPSRPIPEWIHRVDLWVGLLVLSACCAFVFVQLEPHLLFRNTTPSGGDTAAHVWWPAYLRDHLLPWRLAGWSPDFYAGFPAGQFYFPFPALLIIVLDVVLPYNVAFKLITALGPVLLPFGAYVFGRGIRAPNPAPAGFAVAATAWLFFTGSDETLAFNQRIAGGTLASNLAGEFSFTIALALALAFMGMFAYTLRTGRLRWVPAVLLAATVTSHLIVAIFAAVGAFAVWLAYRPWFNLRRALAIGAVGALLSAVWALPLVATLGYTTDMRYDAIACSEKANKPGVPTCKDHQNLDPERYLFPPSLTGVDEGAALPWEFVGGWMPWEWGALTLTGIAIAGAVVRRGRHAQTVGALLFLALVSAVLFRFWEDVQTTTVWNLRLLPFWYVSVFLLMGLGVSELIRGAGWLARKFALEWGTVTSPKLLRAVTIALLTPIIAIGVLVDVNQEKNRTDGFLTGWINWNYLGYEDTTGGGKTIPKAYPEYRSLIDALDSLPPGRATWEGNTQLNEYGSPLALMLLPYWTDGRIGSMEGVYYEASATTPYHFMTVATLAAPGNASNAVRGLPYRDSTEFSLGVRWLQLLGVRYFVTHSAESKAAADADERLRLVATSPDTDNKPPLGWSIYRVRSSELVEALEFQPVVVDALSKREDHACKLRVGKLLGKVDANGKAIPVESHEWQDCIAVPWFDSPRALDRPLVDEGPTSWQHAGPRRARNLDKRRLPQTQVTKIRATDDSISFHVSRPGVPVYVKTSYFPNWEVDGARGPYRATPNFMVVVPTERDVTLHYGTTGAEWLGRLGTLAGVAGLSVLAFGPWWRRRANATKSLGSSTA